MKQKKIVKLDSTIPKKSDAEVHTLLDLMRSIQIKEYGLEQKEKQGRQYAKIKR